MDEFIMIKIMNEAMIKLKQSKNEDYKINEELKKDLEDREFFKKISKTTALKLLTAVGVADDRLESTYTKLMNK